MTQRDPPVMPDLCHRRLPFHYVTALMLLKKMGVDFSQLDLRAVGPYENYRGEVLRQEPRPGTLLTESTKIALDVGRESAVDLMPYQFFYGMAGVSVQREGWEDRARGLMAPFDGAVIRWLADAEYEALKYALTTLDRGHLRRFLNMFDFDVEQDATDRRETYLWAALMPSFHHWAGNPRLVARVLRHIFECNIEIRENVASSYPIPVEMWSRLGKSYSQLGSGLVLGQTVTDFDSGYEVVVSGIAADEVRSWLPGQVRRKRLERLLEICMPGNLQHRIRLKVDYEACPLGQKAHRSYLGMSTYLPRHRLTAVAQQP